MKKLIIVFVLMASICHSQELEKNKTLSIISAPGAYDDGFNIGAIFEYTNNWIYAGPEVFAFPKLNHTGEYELPYYHAIARGGVNHYFNHGINPIGRIYSGIRIGAIFRDKQMQFYQLLGLEAGFDIILWDTIITGINITSDLKNDSKYYSKDDNHTVNSVFVKLGIRF